MNEDTEASQGAPDLTTSPTAKQRRTTDKTRRREEAARKKRIAAAAKAAAEEDKAERAAPLVQRNPVFSLDGDMIRGARLEFDGKTVHRNNPIRTLAVRGRGKEHALFRKAHADAVDRLIAIFDEGQGGVSAGVSLYEQRSSSLPQTGIISEGTMRAVNNQIDARREIEALKTYFGESWNILYAVCILGVPINVWAARAKMREEPAAGYIVAILDRLVGYWAPERDGPGKIRTIEFTS